MDKKQIRERLQKQAASHAPGFDAPSDDGADKYVGVYLRIGARTVNAVQTIEMLTQNYRSFVESQPGWHLCKFYIDEGSAKRKSGQTAFLEMIDDARNHRINWVVAQGLGRFSKNVDAAIEAIHELAGLDPPVGVYIEAENIYSLSKGSLFLLDIIRAVATEEARNKSRLMRFGTFSG